MPQSDIAASEKTPNTTLFIEFPATYQRAGTGYQLATSKGTWEPFAVEGAADNRKAAVFSSAFKLLAVALMVKLCFRCDCQGTKAERNIIPSADGYALLA